MEEDSSNERGEASSPDVYLLGDENPQDGATCHKSWAEKHPSWLLALFCAIMFLVWFDNGMFASNGVTGCSKHCAEPVGFPTAQGDFDLGPFQLGVLAAMYMVGLMIASVILIPSACLIPPFQLIGIGMSVWALAAVGTGLSRGFVSLMIARTLVGAGEASIITLSAPFIDDVAPADYVSLWFAILSVAPPLGVALGYIFGGVAQYIGWRVLFFLEAVVGVLIALIALLAPNVGLRGAGDTAITDAAAPPLKREKLTNSLWKLWADLKILHRHPVFIVSTLANAPIQASVGAFTFWGPKMARELFDLSLDAANLTLGALTIVCAILGIIGGVSAQHALLDLNEHACLESTIGNFLDPGGITINSKRSPKVQIFSAVTGLVFCAISLNFVAQFWLFCMVFGVGLFGLFIATAPLYAMGMWSLPAAQRPTGQAYLVVIMHALGDVPSPPIAGAVQSAVHNWHISMTVIVAYLLVSVALYSLGLYLNRSAELRGPQKASADEDVAAPLAS